jgi:hypothetical protein
MILLLATTPSLFLGLWVNLVHASSWLPIPSDLIAKGGEKRG